MRLPPSSKPVLIEGQAIRIAPFLHLPTAVPTNLLTRRHRYLLMALLSLPLVAQAPPGWQDSLVNHLAGSWKLEGKVMGNNAHHDVQADWVLNHQFLRIQEKTAASAPAAERRYDSIWYLGYDPTSERYVL